jgi:hypothetical protein
MRMSRPVRNLLLANGATLAAALLLEWDAGWLLWPYWIQSVVIGWYARRRMLALVRFSTEGFTSNGRRVPEDESGKRSTANFFALHYGSSTSAIWCSCSTATRWANGAMPPSCSPAACRSRCRSARPMPRSTRPTARAAPTSAR